MIFGRFSFAGEVLLGRIAAFYGFCIPAAEYQTSLANFVRARLPHDPTLGDRIRLEDIELVVRGMNGERITRIELELEPPQAAFASLSC
ncbi:MAG TPA: transporter associated domain-containing protein [Geminicoccaceae bacterium]|nr:transporter associated domain-containing protein [Geminicoccaceae bacterium]